MRTRIQIFDAFDLLRNNIELPIYSSRFDHTRKFIYTNIVWPIDDGIRFPIGCRLDMAPMHKHRRVIDPCDTFGGKIRAKIREQHGTQRRVSFGIFRSIHSITKVYEKIKLAVHDEIS